MDKFQKEFIGIIHAAFTNEKYDISSDFNWEKAVAVAKKHNISPILFYGALNCGVSKEEKYMQLLHRLTLRSMMVSMRQAYEIEQIEKAFDKEQIEYMPLKGIILKELYPKSEMRTMGDADILIKLQQYSKIESIVKGLQYEFKYESDHELVWQKPTLFLELHKSIMTSYNKDFYDYFGNGWNIAKNVPNSSRYEMSPEDFYIFIFVHFAKHYRISGIGIKHLLDIWVYSNAHNELDWVYIEKELEKMRLYEFHTNVKRTIDVWFANLEDTNITDLITSVIFSSGQYGSAEMAIVNRSLQNGKKSALGIRINNMLHSVFLPYKAMKEKYAVLQKAPILLPVMWVVRCFDVLLFHKTRLKKFTEGINQIDSNKMRENEKALYLVGLAFSKGE